MRSRSILLIAALLIAGVAIGGWLIARANRSIVGMEQTTQAGDVRMTLRVDNTVSGIYLMNADGSELRRIDQVGDHGGLDWPAK